MQADFDKTTVLEGTEMLPSLFASRPPSPLLNVSVIVPVRNEAHHLHQTLDALRMQTDETDLPVSPAIYEVLLLANNCTDCSYEIAIEYQQQYPNFPLLVAKIQLPTPKANIGTVRRLLMDEAYSRLTSVGNSEGIIASTDGDTVVDRHWLYYIMHEITNGNDAVGGRILTYPDQSRVRLFHLRDVLYRTLVAKAEARIDPCPHDPWPRHFQHFGASIAVTCRMYEQAGRLPEKPYLEDEAFYRALVRNDAKIRKSPHVKVFTSTRMQGQVAVGFSEQLRYWANLHQSGKTQIVEPAEAILVRFQNRQVLRVCWQTRHQADHTHTLATVAKALFLDSYWLDNKLQTCRYFGELWETITEQMVANQWAKQWALVPITTAIQELRQFLKP